MADPAGVPEIGTEGTHHAPKDKFFVLALGAVGVVFGDIGTSPLYAMREALHHSKGGGGGESVCHSSPVAPNGFGPAALA